MYCPKCGQITVNLNGRDICTKCGIVFDNALPREQVLSQIRSKMAKQVSSNEEQYTSPIAVAKRKNSQEKIISNKIPADTAKTNTPSRTKTLEDIQREIRAGQRPPEDSATQSQNTLSRQEAMPEGDFLRGGEGAVSAPEAPIIHEFNEPSGSQPASSIQNISADSIASNTPAVNITPQNTSEKDTLSSESINTYENQAVYPSHQVNPILIKIFITVFSILVFFVIVYILYANFGAARGLVDNIIRFLGERVFG
jgi:uncharacterized Zn finger protein (UPF0148 family)